MQSHLPAHAATPTSSCSYAYHLTQPRLPPHAATPTLIEFLQSILVFLSCTDMSRRNNLLASILRPRDHMDN